ncbi:macrophage mannose receptor 1-like [Ostrea edulis]|uniref:macrophage mannose receptor 1-like n=1 Tax=Ostrea edulis TaxID=37623 RepID=UPI0024AFD1B0|nr:macrophage mannose receptor 1-like [Ostrea edulis]
MTEFVRCLLVIYGSFFIAQALSVPDELRSLCPKDIALDPQYVWTYGSSCLQLSLDKHDWPHARERCQRHGGDLVQIRSADIQGSIIQKIRQLHHHVKTGFWIGASDQHHEGRWEWVSGEKTMTYDNWSPHQGPHQTGFLLIPGGGTEDCGLLKVDDNFMWHDYPCHSGIAFFYPYICQFEIPQTTRAAKLSTTTSISHPTPLVTYNFKSTPSTTTTTLLTTTSPTALLTKPSVSSLKTSTFLSILTAKHSHEITQKFPLLTNKNTTNEQPNNPTTEEREIFVTEHSQHVTEHSQHVTEHSQHVIGDNQQVTKHSYHGQTTAHSTQQGVQDGVIIIG